MPTLRTSDGTELYYRDWGAGRPVVFVHSMLMSGHMWEHQMLHLVEHGYRAVAYDRRGHGRSDDPGSGYEFDTLADDLAAVLTTLELTDVTLVGHSMGGGEIVRYLSRHGDQRVSGIALVGATVPKLDLGPAEATQWLDQLRDGYGQWVADSTAASFGSGLPSRAIPPVETQRTIQDWMGVSLKAAVDCAAAHVAADFSAEMREITVPALVVHGDSDLFGPLDVFGRRSAELIPDSRFLVYRDAPHMLQLSHRQQLNADLLAFVRCGPDDQEAPAVTRPDS
ncbi:alpha/beta fold hydrolase [Actinocrispum wychmicini]|uniref:Pimeloyl-ACP methyl ester carboxylesterase n=1 Tax=Actinocrispum wychmicini TaxID=1213861 RepID=A0A4R2JM37_9PSEU|nr:alpha/beta hydrolase [Actinocrispum wychmicini]TCO59672.1 pimeloyl-ACP methyl ester carboxylesterase [Actinocrispum wychmicini]